MHFRLSTLVLIAVIVATGCTDYAERTQVTIVIDADGSVRERIRRVDVDVHIGPVDGSDWQPRLSKPLEPAAGRRGWPLELPLVRRDTDGLAGYLVTAVAKDADDVTIAQVRAISGYVRGRTLELLLRFDAACASRDMLCSDAFTCLEGQCVDPFFEPDTLPTRRPVNDSPAPREGAAGGSAQPSGGGGSSPAPCEGSTCDPPTSPCVANHGGCDPLVRCTSSNGKPICAACPEGFTGDGRSACIPALTGLEPARGALSPAFSSEHEEYVVELPLVGDTLELRPRAAEDVSILIDGEQLAPGTSWTTPTLRFGDNRFVLTLRIAGHASSTYSVNVRRIGHELGILKPEFPGADDWFGRAIALQGDTLVVGAPREDGGGTGVNPTVNEAVRDSGAAYVFVRKAGEWHQQAYLKADAPVAEAFFGDAVALDGDRIAVGAPQQEGTGVVYLFERQQTTWQLSTALHPDPGNTPSYFGASVALQRDRVAVGASADDDVHADSGAVYVFERDSSAAASAAWIRKARLKASNAGLLDWFGSSVAMDGDYLLSGATGATVDGLVWAGLGYVFRAGPSGWSEVGILVPNPPEQSAWAGEGVAVSGDSFVLGTFGGGYGLIGIAHSYVRQADDTFPHEQGLRARNPTSGDYFGCRVALQGDTLVAGSAHESSAGEGVGNESGGTLANSGAAYLFTREAGVWRQLVQLKPARPSAHEEFGYNVAISGETIAVSAVNALPESANSGSVHLFR